MASSSVINNPKSLAWKFFKIDNDDEKIAICSLCKIKLSRGHTKGYFNTTNMLRHLKRKHSLKLKEAEENLKIEVEKKKTISSSSSVKKLKKSEYDTNVQPTECEMINECKIWDNTDHQSSFPEICEDESQNTNQSSCDRRSSQSSPDPEMTGPYLLKKETHCATILDQLLRDDTFCDVTLTAEGQSLRAHKLVLCLASNYFRQVMSKESNIQNVIVFRDIRFMELKNLITFIYTGEATVDAAELESFMKTAEMLEVTSLCDGQRKFPENLIPRSKEAETEMNKTTFGAKRANSCVSPTPSKTRRIDETPVSRHQTKSVASHPSTSGSGGLFAPQVILSTSIKTEPSEDEDLIDEEYHSFEQCQPSPPPMYHQDSETPSSGETGNDPGHFSDKVLVGKCPFCPNSEQVLQGIALTKHLSTYHPDKTVFCCENCSRAFLKKGAYEAHKHDCNR